MEWYNNFAVVNIPSLEKSEKLYKREPKAQGNEYTACKNNFVEFYDKMLKDVI